MLTKKQRWRRVIHKQPRASHRLPSETVREETGADAGQALLLLDAPRVNKWDPIFSRGSQRQLGSMDRTSSWPRTRPSLPKGGGGSTRNLDAPKLQVGRCASASGAALATGEAVGEPRGVRFDNCVRVLLVPSRNDFDETTAHDVWWDRGDVTKFRSAAYRFFKKHGKLNVIADEELVDSGSPPGMPSALSNLCPAPANGTDMFGDVSKTNTDNQSTELPPNAGSCSVAFETKTNTGVRQASKNHRANYEESSAGTGTTKTSHYDATKSREIGRRAPSSKVRHKMYDSSRSSNVMRFAAHPTASGSNVMKHLGSPIDQGDIASPSPP